MTERKTFIHKIKQGDKIRYAEVWNEREGKKVIQHHVRYLGSDPDNLPDPSSFDIETIHFAILEVFSSRLTSSLLPSYKHPTAISAPIVFAQNSISNLPY